MNDFHMKFNEMQSNVKKQEFLKELASVYQKYQMYLVFEDAGVQYAGEQLDTNEACEQLLQMKDWQVSED